MTSYKTGIKKTADLISGTDMTLPGEKVFTVSELNRKIRWMLESEFVSIWVEGEISNFKHHSSGHMYFSIKDEKSQMNAVFFSGRNQTLKFDLKDGIKVLIFGKISVYEPRGQYQLYVERVEPKGIGALQLAFLQLKEKLEKEGLFETARKREIPKFPRRVGVVTSPTGAAIRDILNIMGRRFSGTAVLLNPVKVQGDGSAKEIATAIEELNEYGQDLDVIIVGRGGGSLEDLWAFNEEIVARAIFASRIPIISAVGHEIDWTIADLVSDLRAPTPSAAAELVVQNREDLEKRGLEMRTRLTSSVKNILHNFRETLSVLEGSYAFKQPKALVLQFSQRLDELMRQNQNYLNAFLSDKRQSFEKQVARLHALSPLHILGRGYSLTFASDESLLKETKNLRKGQTIKTKLSQGTIYSTVEKIEES